MAVKYDKLWALLKEHDMSKNELRAKVKMGPNTMAKMGRNENVSMDVLQRICLELKCNIGDIIEFVMVEEGHHE